MTPRLETERLVLRGFAPGDWEAVRALLAECVVTRRMHFRTWTDEEATTLWPWASGSSSWRCSCLPR